MHLAYRTVAITSKSPKDAEVTNHSPAAMRVWHKSAFQWLLSDTGELPPLTRRYKTHPQCNIVYVMGGVPINSDRHNLVISGVPAEWTHIFLEARFFCQIKGKTRLWCMSLVPWDLRDRPTSPRMVFLLRKGQEILPTPKQIAGPVNAWGWGLWLYEWVTGLRPTPPDTKTMGLYPSDRCVTLVELGEPRLRWRFGPFDDLVTDVEVEPFECILTDGRRARGVRLKPEKKLLEPGVSAPEEHRILCVDGKLLSHGVQAGEAVLKHGLLADDNPYGWGPYAVSWLTDKAPADLDIGRVYYLSTLDELRMQSKSPTLKKGLMVLTRRVKSEDKIQQQQFYVSGLPEAWRGQKLLGRCHARLEPDQAAQWCLTLGLLSEAHQEEARRLTYVLREGEQFLTAPRLIMDSQVDFIAALFAHIPNFSSFDSAKEADQSVVLQCSSDVAEIQAPYLIAIDANGNLRFDKKDYPTGLPQGLYQAQGQVDFRFLELRIVASTRFPKPPAHLLRLPLDTQNTPALTRTKSPRLPRVATLPIPDIKRHFAWADEKQMWETYIAGGRSDPALLQTLIASHERLIRSSISRILGQRKHDFKDPATFELIEVLYPIGQAGLWRATEDFSLDRGTKFSTYAGWWVTARVKRYLDEQSGISVGALQTIRRIWKYLKENNLTLNDARQLDEAGLEKMAEKIERSITTIKNLFKPGVMERSLATNEVSLETPINDEGNTLGQFISDESLRPDTIVIDADRDETVRKIFEEFEQQDSVGARVLKHRQGFYTAPLSLEEIGKRAVELGINTQPLTRESVRKLEIKAIKKFANLVRHCRAGHELYTDIVTSPSDHKRAQHSYRNSV